MILSIVIPFYNGDDFICKLLDSIKLSHTKSQQVIKLDIIIVIDSNSDEKKLQQIIDNSTYNFPYKISFLKNPVNLGVAKSRDIGIINSIGDYLTFIDQDDYVVPEYISKIENIIQNNFDILYLNGNVVNLLQNKSVPVNYFKPEITLKKLIYNNLFISPSFIIVKRSILDKYNIRFFNEKISSKGVDDLNFQIKLHQNCELLKSTYINHRIVNYCIHSTNYSHDIKQQIEGNIEVLNYFYKECINYKSDIDLKIRALNFSKDILSKNKLTFSLKHPFSFYSYFIIYMNDFNRLIRLIHRIVISMRIR